MSFLPNFETPEIIARWKGSWSQLNRLKQALFVVLGVVGLLTFSIILLFFSVKLGFFGPLPDKEDLANIRNHTASEIYDKEGDLLGKYFIEDRDHISLENISPYLIDALIATEDTRFYDHDGVDTKSLIRVAVKSILLGDKSSGGGSTLSQQLVKNLFPREDHGLLTMPVNKFKEMITARRLEEVYSKKEILSLYLNTVSFGESVFGIAAAADRFFSSDPASITIEQAAVLVGMLKATTTYSPRLNPDRSLARRNVVLGLMVNNDVLTEQTADSLKQLPLELNYHNINQGVGLAPYFRQQVAEELKQYFRDHPRPDGKPLNLYTDGLRIYTTINMTMQRYAEKAVESHMKSLQATFEKHWKNRKIWQTDDPQIQKAIKESQRYILLKQGGMSESQIEEVFRKPVKMTVWTWDGEVEREISPLDSIMYYQSFLQAGFMVMEASTGAIMAWVGGINHEYFKYDHVTANRQVGSTFKPFVYAAAIEKGIDPCEYIANQKVAYEEYENWEPGNADGKYEGYYSLQGGLTHSVNTISAAVMKQVGVKEAHDFAERFGFTSELPEAASLVLGTADISLREMVAAYAVFANRGIWVKPTFIVRVEDSKGNLIVDYTKLRERKRVLDPTTADMMNHMLKSVVESGTAQRLRTVYGLQSEIGGKTGTTQDQTDGWFIGITPNLVAGAWVGGETRQVRFRSLSLGQGANTALPIYGKFMQQFYNRYKKERYANFQEPGVSALKSLDCEMYKEDLYDNGIEELLYLLKQRRIERQLEKMEERDSYKYNNRKRWEDLFKKNKRR